ncbi:MAG: hypothetical protein HOP16_16965 [Acidobacteria bacterium]|nr:hypothetical protein [Acidobacteriota bacterium]
MNLAHLHLLLNHVPTLGFAVGIGLFLAALFRQSADLRRISLETLYIVALVAIPAYLTGNAAHFVLQSRGAELADAVITAHQDAAMLALIVMEITGAVAWIALWRFRRWTIPTVLVLSLVTFGLMARAAAIGGEINHPEIRADAPFTTASFWPRAATIGTSLIVENPWVWPIAEIIHFVGLCLLFGVVLTVSLRMLGFLGGVALRDLRRLLPWGMVGLGINIVTGMLFFLASPDQYTQNASFSAKMALMLGGGVMLLYPTLLDDDAPDARPSLEAKVVAVLSIIVWIGVLFFGRFLPYLGSE